MSKLVKKWRYPRMLVFLAKESKKERKEVKQMKARNFKKEERKIERSTLVFSHPQRKARKNKGAIITSLFTTMVAIAAIIFVFILFNKNNKLNAELNKDYGNGQIVYILTQQELDELVAKKAAENPVEVIKEIEVEKLVEVPVEVEVIKEVPVEVEVEVIKEVEVPVETIVEKEVIKEVEVEKEIFVEVPVETIVEKEVIKEVEVPVEVPVYYVDGEKVNELAEQKAQELFEAYKQWWEEAHPEPATSTIRVLVTYKNSSKSNFYLELEGKAGQKLTWNMIQEALFNSEEFEGYKIERITNKNAVEYFDEEGYTSTRIIRIEMQ